MMQMTFYVSSSVTLLFDFWNVHSPAGMVLSVFVVLLLTVFYEVLKVWRMRLGTSFGPGAPGPADVAPPLALSGCSDCSSALGSSSSETTLAPGETPPRTQSSRNRWLSHLLQTVLHMLQVSLGYMLMLCVMSYNTWIFLGVVGGAVLGYFVSFPLLDRLSSYSSVKQ